MTTDDKLDRILALLAQLLSQQSDKPEPQIDLSAIGMPVKLRQQALSLIDEWNRAWGVVAGPKTQAVLDALPSRILFPRVGHELTEGEQSLLDAAYRRALGDTPKENLEYSNSLIRGTLPGYYPAIGPGGVEIEGLGLHPDPNPGVRQKPIKYHDEVIKERAYRQMRRLVYPAILDDNPGRQIVDGLPKD